jgi:multidrug transporter EmrE-like cation transporter
VLKKYDQISDETHVIARKSAAVQGSFGGFFMFTMFFFYIYAYGIASAFLQYDVKSPQTGEKYTIYEIVAVSQAALMSVMTFGGIAPIVPQIVRGLASTK